MYLRDGLASKYHAELAPVIIIYYGLLLYAMIMCIWSVYQLIVDIKHCIYSIDMAYAYLYRSQLAKLSVVVIATGV